MALSLADTLEMNVLSSMSNKHIIPGHSISPEQFETFLNIGKQQVRELVSPDADLGLSIQRLHTQEASLGFDKVALNQIIASIGSEGRSA